MKTNPSPLIVCAFALALTFTTPAFSQYYCGTCSGSACQLSAGAAPAAARTTTTAAPACAPCRYYQTSGTFAPFGGFFRSLFGGSCGFTSSTASSGTRALHCERNGARASSTCGTPCSASARGGIADAAGGCSNCSGGEDCSVDPVEREFVPESGAEDASSCTEAEETTCEPCGTASNEDVEASELERRLVEVANGARERRGLGRLLLDGRLLSWARYNSSLQASYCRLGHFSGFSYEIAGEGYSTPEAAVQGWEDSAPHAVLLFGRFSRVGASVYRGRNGRLYWSMTFGN